MTKTVDEYLERLDAALGAVPYATAREIRAGVEEELRSLDPTEADERMRELGDPADIAAAAAAGSLRETPVTPSWAADGATAPPWTPGRTRANGTASPVYVVLTGLAIAVGLWVVPIAGWIAGIVLLWSSVVWRRWEKVVATVVPVAAAGVLAAVLTVLAAVEEQQRTTAYRSELQADEFHAPGIDEFAAGNPFVPATYDLLWTAPLVIGLLNLAIGVWLLVVAFRRGLAPVSPGRIRAAGGDGVSAMTGIGAAMLVTGLLGALAVLAVTRNPIGAGAWLLLAVAGLVLLVARAVSRR